METAVANGLTTGGANSSNAGVSSPPGDRAKTNGASVAPPKEYISHDPSNSTPPIQEASAESTRLIKEIAADTQRLIEQHWEMGYVEIRNECVALQQATWSLALAFGLGIASAVPVLLGISHGLTVLFPSLPLWGAYLITGVAGALIGGGIGSAASTRIANINLIPERTIKSAKESVPWNPKQA